MKAGFSKNSFIKKKKMAAVVNTFMWVSDTQKIEPFLNSQESVNMSKILLQCLAHGKSLLNGNDKHHPANLSAL